MFFRRMQDLCFKIMSKMVSPHGAAELMRSKFHYLGRNVQLYSCSIPEPYLVSIHDNVICAANVRFINHDVSCFNIDSICCFMNFSPLYTAIHTLTLTILY